MNVYTCPPDHKHALTLCCYPAHGCRCSDCRHAHAEYMRGIRRLQQKPVTVPVLGTMRRLRALATLGWSTVAISEHTGIPSAQLWTYRKGQRKRLNEGTARAIAHFYRDNCYTFAPETHLTRSMIARAKAAGWASPIAWHDPDTDLKPHSKD